MRFEYLRRGWVEIEKENGEFGRKYNGGVVKIFGLEAVPW